MVGLVVRRRPGFGWGVFVSRTDQKVELRAAARRGSVVWSPSRRLAAQDRDAILAEGEVG